MKYVITGIMIISCIFGMAAEAPAADASPVPVFVSIIPQKYFVQKIGGEHVEISAVVESGGNPHSYEPKPAQMTALSKARIYFAIGVNFENSWLEKFAAINPNMHIVHTQEGIEKIPMKAHDHDEREHDIKDPHIWLSPPLVMIQAQNILKGLVMADPSHQAIYETNCKKFITELTELDTEFRHIFQPKSLEKEKAVNSFMVFHPSWGYFAHAYGLEQIPVETEGKEPKPAELQQLIQYARDKGIRVIFVQPQFSTRSAAVIANAIGGQIVFADPLAPDWADNLHEIGKKFKAALK